MIIKGKRITWRIIKNRYALLAYSFIINLVMAIIFSSKNKTVRVQSRFAIICVLLDFIIFSTLIFERFRDKVKWQHLIKVIRIIMWIFLVVMCIIRIIALIPDTSGRFPGEDLLYDPDDPDALRGDSYRSQEISPGYIVFVVFAVVCDCGLLTIWWEKAIKGPTLIFAVSSIANILVSVASLQINLDLINLHFIVGIKRVHNLYVYASCVAIVASTVGLFIFMLISEKNRLNELMGRFITYYNVFIILVTLLSFACFLTTFAFMRNKNSSGDFPVSLPILFGISLLLDIVEFMCSRFFRHRRQPKILTVEEYDLRSLSDFQKAGWAKLINFNHRFNSGVNGEAIISLMSAYCNSKLDGMECKVLRVYIKSDPEPTPESSKPDIIHEKIEEFKEKTKLKKAKKDEKHKDPEKKSKKENNPDEQPLIAVSQPENPFANSPEDPKLEKKGTKDSKLEKKGTKDSNVEKKAKAKEGKKAKAGKKSGNEKDDAAAKDDHKTKEDKKSKDEKKDGTSDVDLEKQATKDLENAWDYLDKDAVLFEEGRSLACDANTLDEYKPLSKNQAKKLAKKQKDSKLLDQIDEIQEESKRFYKELMETEALVFLTVITEFDLTERIPGIWGKKLNKWFGKGSRYPILCIKFGLLGFHWPFKRSTLYCSSTKKPIARSAAIMYSIAQWNQTNEKCTILLDPTYKHDYSETGIGLSGWIKVALPNSHIIDLRPYRNSTLAQYFKGVKYRSQENTFKAANGVVLETFDFSMENCQMVVDMNQNISETRTEGNQSDTLLHPTALFIKDLGDNNNENKYRSLLYLKVDDKVIASCVIFRLGDTITSDIQGLDHEISKKYKAYFVMMQEVIRMALEEKISFVDFGPTTENAKVNIGCEVVPLVGSLYPRNKLLGPIVKLAASKVDV